MHILTPRWTFSRQERVAFKRHEGYSDAKLVYYTSVGSVLKHAVLRWTLPLSSRRRLFSGVTHLKTMDFDHLTVNRGHLIDWNC